MSWDWDPYRHQEFGLTAEGNVVLYCGKCGMEKDIGPMVGMWVEALVVRWREHVRDSHKLTPEDTRDWSAPGKRWVPGPPEHTHVIRFEGAGQRSDEYGHYE
jgi:hypothetical protein